MSAPQVLATSVLQATASTPTELSQKTVFASGNGRFFASCRVGGKTKFLGTYDQKNLADDAVKNFLHDTASVAQPTFQFY